MCGIETCSSVGNDGVGVGVTGVLAVVGMGWKGGQKA